MENSRLGFSDTSKMPGLYGTTHYLQIIGINESLVKIFNSQGALLTSENLLEEVIVQFTVAGVNDASEEQSNGMLCFLATRCRFLASQC